MSSALLALWLLGFTSTTPNGAMKSISAGRSRSSLAERVLQAGKTRPEQPAQTSKFEPKFIDSRARKVWEAAVGAYGHLRHVSMVVRSGGVADRVAISGNRAYEDQPRLRWAYDGARLAISSGGKVKRSKIAPGDIPSKVGPLIDPLLQAWALHRNPARVLAPTGTTVRVAGNVVVNGVPCDVVELTRPYSRLTALVRRSDHLFARITSKNLDPRSTVVSSIDREFRYSSVGKPLPASTFRVH